MLFHLNSDFLIMKYHADERDRELHFIEIAFNYDFIYKWIDQWIDQCTGINWTKNWYGSMNHLNNEICSVDQKKVKVNRWQMINGKN